MGRRPRRTRHPWTRSSSSCAPTRPLTRSAHDAGPGRDVGAPDAARCERPGHDFAEGLPGSGVKPLAGVVFCFSGTNLYHHKVFIADRLLLSLVLSVFDEISIGRFF